MAECLVIGRTRVEIVAGDITTQDVDAIANAANSSLMGGGGVDGAIHRAGGPAVDAECKEIVRRQGRLPAGKAVITGAGNMPARHVIHTVGPVYPGKGRDDARSVSSAAATLASCFTESLALADANGLASLAFPAISTGAYGYPLDEAARVSLEAVAGYLRGETGVELVRFVLFGERALDAFARAADALVA